mgnify:CR=1 FL=1
MKTTKESNIVIFPKLQRHDKPPQSEEEMVEKLISYKKASSDEVTDMSLSSS